MTTSTKRNKTDIISIEVINDNVMFIVNDEYTAKALLKKNAQAQVQKGEDDQYAVIYKADMCNLMNAVRRK